MQLDKYYVTEEHQTKEYEAIQILPETKNFIFKLLRTDPDNHIPLEDINAVVNKFDHHWLVKDSKGNYHILTDTQFLKHAIKHDDQPELQSKGNKG